MNFRLSLGAAALVGGMLAIAQAVQAQTTIDSIGLTVTTTPQSPATTGSVASARPETAPPCS
jgi:hypothetical protein